MAYHDIPYLNLVKDVLEHGVEKVDRTGVGTIAVFGRQMRFDLSDGTIPLLTTKKMHVPAIIHEILWYLSGSGNVQYLRDNGVRIWNEWAGENGDLGPVYGVQWRKWPQYKWNEQAITYERTFIDQIKQLVDQLKTNPDSRRLLVSAWNVSDLDEMALPPCHYSFQCFTEKLSLRDRIYESSKTHYVPDLLALSAELISHTLDEVGVPSRKLSLILNMRSNDVGLGNPFNIVQYSILLRMLCEVVNMTPGEFIWNGGDVHIYTNHIDALKEQTTREPFASPTLSFTRKVSDIDDFKFEDFVIGRYEHHPTISMKVAV
jgi:thymidylate synthase